MNLLIRSAITFTVACSFCLAWAQAASTPIAPPVPGAALASQQELAVLQAQLATMQTYTDRLLSTVYFALGSVVVVAGLLVGFGWYTSSRVHDRDLAAIRNELLRAHQTDAQRLRLDVEAELKSAIAGIGTNVVEQSRKAASDTVAPVQARIQGIAKTVAELDSRVTRGAFQAEAWYWELAGVKDNQLRYELELLRLAHKEKDPVEIPEALQKLQQLIEAGTTVYVSDISDMVAILDQLPSHFAVNAEGLRNALRTAKRL